MGVRVREEVGGGLEDEAIFCAGWGLGKVYWMVVGAGAGLGVDTRGVDVRFTGVGAGRVTVTGFTWTFCADEGGGEARMSLGRIACLRHSLSSTLYGQ